MKRIAFLMVALLMVGGLAMAQGRRMGGMKMDPKERAEKMTERMAKEYSLNEAQKKELLDVNLALNEKMAKKAEDKKVEKEEMHKEMKANRDAYEAQLKKIMTEEQYASYTKNQAERMKKMKDGKGPRRGGAPDAE
ncbi:DUF4890 domain-containing protein [Bacteroides ihuae]|uniref:DUF4890 domain-containing protein n=1 Tax=Bacteroides ihuae TaxID=1852362 RepID=UPI0008D94923|nr:DUF4890 domain-containing protein [Bacteroides ihuae]